MNDANVLARAGAILSARKEAQEAEVKRLYAQYARKRAGEPYQLGKPKLTPGEAVVLVALEARGYEVEADCPNKNRWHGDASCVDHLRETVIITMAASRRELLWELWAAVTGQDIRRVVLNEKHLREVRRN